MFNILAQCQIGGGTVTISPTLTGVVSIIISAIKIGVPILLIIFGMLDLGKAVIAQKDDEIKKGQQTFIKRLIAAAVVFFVVVIVQLIISIVAGGDNENIWSCVNDIINGQ